MFASLRLLTAALLLASLAPCIAPPRVAAQSEEARLRFERGNEHLARALRTRGQLRERALDQALDAYLGVLSLGSRTRNVVFNTALTLDELGRHEEAFNYYGEYLRFDLGPDERAEGARRIDALRPRVAVLRVESAPPGAEVRVGRRDLPVRGVTPLEVAVPAGAHRVFVLREGYAEATREMNATTGDVASVRVELTPSPIALQVIAPEGTLTLDGRPIAPGRTLQVAPGTHVVRLEVEGATPVERRFEVRPGDRPLVLELSAPSEHRPARIAVTVDAPADVFVDELHVGTGERVEIPAQPGPHALRVSAPGHNPLVHRLTLAPRQTLRLEVELGRAADATGIHVARAVLGGLAIAGVATSIGLGVHALSLSDAWHGGNEERWSDPQRARPTIAQLEAIASDLEDAALMTDVALGATLALGVATLITLFVDPGEGEPSSVRVGAAPTTDGFVAALGWRTP